MDSFIAVEKFLGESQSCIIITSLSLFSAHVLDFN